MHEPDKEAPPAFPSPLTRIADADMRKSRPAPPCAQNCQLPTKTGLSVKAALDEGIYPKGQKISRKDVDDLNLTPHDVCPDWNYTIRPKS